MLMLIGGVFSWAVVTDSICSRTALLQTVGCCGSLGTEQALVSCVACCEQFHHHCNCTPHPVPKCRSSVILAEHAQHGADLHIDAYACKPPFCAGHGSPLEAAGVHKNTGRQHARRTQQVSNKTVVLDLSVLDPPHCGTSRSTNTYKHSATQR
jgi:hypothetical protein